MSNPITRDEFRINGVYAQGQEGLYMLRVKVPVSRLTSAQARGLAMLGAEVGSGVFHLTTRMSLEFHDLTEEEVVCVVDELPKLGLTSRGACGGAVRGIALSTPPGQRSYALESFGRVIMDRFLGKPEFEGLPKKFKVGLDVGYDTGRHLIQDFGIVLTSADGKPLRFDLWVAGGLGRMPMEGFSLERGIDATRALTLLEATVRLYREYPKKGKRLKHYRQEVGEKELRRLIRDVGYRLDVPHVDLPVLPHEPVEAPAPVIVDFFGGQLSSDELATLARLAEVYSDSTMLFTVNQNVAIIPSDGDTTALQGEAVKAGFTLAAENAGGFRVCPGNHECKMGLAPTREVAAELIEIGGERGRCLEWAISGCPNSCAQPQLADIGVIGVKLMKDDEGSRTPLYDLLKRDSEGFGEKIAEGIELDELRERVRKLVGEL